MIRFEVQYNPEDHEVVIIPLEGTQDPLLHFDAITNINFCLARYFLAFDPEAFAKLKKRAREIVLPQLESGIKIPYYDLQSTSIE